VFKPTGVAQTAISEGVVVVVMHISKSSLYLIPSVVIYELRHMAIIVLHLLNSLTTVSIISPKVVQKLAANPLDNSFVTVWSPFRW
jgi:hypothetical protein